MAKLIFKDEESSLRILREGSIIFDTSALCNIYELTESDVKKIAEVLKYLSKSIWIPWQVHEEYNKNRSKSIHNPIQGAHELRLKLQKYNPISQISTLVSEMEKNMKFHPILVEVELNSFKSDFENLKKNVYFSCRDSPKKRKRNRKRSGKMGKR